MLDRVYQYSRYAGVERSEILAHLRRDGWTPHLIEEPAGYTYTLHHHAETKLVVILIGEMDVTLAGEPLYCRPGDELIISDGTEHAAIMGPDGCSYFWREQLRPDPLHERVTGAFGQR